MKALLLALIFVLVLGCNPTEEEAQDAGLSTGPDSGAIDAGTLDAKASDAGTRPDAGGTLDAGPVGPAGPLALVQCRSSADCGGPNGSCTLTAPGGVCVGCGDNADCPFGTTCSPVGACVRGCTSDASCNAGMTCTSSGKCALRSCPCPAPYVCDSNNRCARPSCPGGSCPSPLSCNQGLCLEP